MKLRLLLALLLAGPRVLAAQSLGVDPDPPTKKDLYLAAKASATTATRPVRPDQAASPVINIVNKWTLETVAVDQKAPRNAPPEISPADTARFFRCHFTNQIAADYDPKLFELVVKAARHFKSTRVEIVSGYRAPKYNLMLRKKGRNVARDSQHAVGNAVDFRVDGVPTLTLMRWVRQQRMGGVGYYPNSRFVHADTGPVRYWLGE